MSYHLPEIPFLAMKFILSAQEEALLSTIKGSMLRGAFGHALKRTVCVMGNQQSCETCMLRKQCVYTRIFETFIEGEAPEFLKGLKTSPRPFIIDAPDTKRDYKVGDELEFYVKLFGRACELHPYIIFAFSLAAERGLTKREHRFQLKRVDWMTDDWQLLYDGESKCLCQMARPSLIPQDGKMNAPITLKFLTPTRIKVESQLTIDFSFRTLVFKMLRRTLEVAHFHVPDANPDWNFHELLERASDVRIIERKLYWDDWKRYSHQQNTTLNMGGFFGELVLDGNLEPFGQLLKTSEVLHVGKGTVFGLGKVRVGSDKDQKEML